MRSLVAVWIVEDRRVTKRGHLIVLPLRDGSSLAIAVPKAMQIPREILAKPANETRRELESWLKSRKDPYAIGSLAGAKVQWTTAHKAWIPETHPEVVVLGTRDPVPFFDALVQHTAPDVLARMLAASSLEIDPSSIAAKSTYQENDERSDGKQRRIQSALIATSAGLLALVLFLIVSPDDREAASVDAGVAIAAVGQDAGVVQPISADKPCLYRATSACAILAFEYPLLSRYCEHAAEIQPELDQVIDRSCAIEKLSPAASIDVWEARESRARQALRAIASKALVKNVLKLGKLKSHADALEPLNKIGPKTVGKALKQAKLPMLKEADAAKLAGELSLAKGIPSQVDLINGLTE